MDCGHLRGRGLRAADALVEEGLGIPSRTRCDGRFDETGPVPARTGDKMEACVAIYSEDSSDPSRRDVNQATVVLAAI